MGNKNIATKLLLQFVDRKIYVSVWYEFLLKGTSEHTLIQSYVSMITSSALVHFLTQLRH